MILFIVKSVLWAIFLLAVAATVIALVHDYKTRNHNDP